MKILIVLYSFLEDVGYGNRSRCIPIAKAEPRQPEEYGEFTIYWTFFGSRIKFNNFFIHISDTRTLNAGWFGLVAICSITLFGFASYYCFRRSSTVVVEDSPPPYHESGQMSGTDIFQGTPPLLCLYVTFFFYR